ncbi:MAG: transposase [Gammaproteobacteria bacterium]
MAVASQLPHGRALRVGRSSEPNRIYLVTAVTRDRARIFELFAAGRILVSAFRFEERQKRAKTLAYVVMPDHFHWLVQLGQKEPLPRVVQFVKNISARNVNRISNRTGQRVWQPGFHDHAVRREEDLAAIARYIVANPLRSGLVQRIGDYPLWDAIWV